MRTLMLCTAVAMLSLFASWCSIAAAPLSVSNIGEPGKMAYVTCDLNLSSKIAIGIAPGNQTSIIFPHANSILCVGTYNTYSHGYYHERPYVLYDSNKGKDNCNDKCLIRVTKFGFESWDVENKVWKAIRPIIHVA